MTYPLADGAHAIDRLEAITGIVRGGAATVKEVRHDARGRISQIIESPFSVATLAKEGEELSDHLTNQNLARADRLRAVRAQVRFALAIERYVDERSQARIRRLIASTEADWFGVDLR